MQVAGMTMRRKISDSNGYCDTDPISPTSPSSSDTKPNQLRSFKHASFIETSSEKTSKPIGVATPKSRTMKPSQKIIRKSLTSDIEKIAPGNIFEQSDTTSVATPMHVAKKKTSFHHTDSTAKLTQILVKKDQEFLTPKLSSKNKDRRNLNNGSFDLVLELAEF